MYQAVASLTPKQSSDMNENLREEVTGRGCNTAVRKRQRTATDRMPSASGGEQRVACEYSRDVSFVCV
jgi:hypothetical protein